MESINRRNRAYDATDLPTLTEGITGNDRVQLLLKLYEQTCSTWRQLVEVRFKLLGFVPAGSVGLLATVFVSTKSSEDNQVEFKMMLAVVGLLATIGLWIYDQRNSALHDDLISRARKIEQELKVDTGVFLGRLNSRGLIKHDTATTLIYGACLLGWSAAIIMPVVGR